MTRVNHEIDGDARPPLRKRTRANSNQIRTSFERSSQGVAERRHARRCYGLGSSWETPTGCPITSRIAQIVVVPLGDFTVFCGRCGTGLLARLRRLPSAWTAM